MTDVLDPFDARLALGATGTLRAFNEAGVLSAADVHVAQTLGRLAGGVGDELELAVALAVRAPRLGHVDVDLASIRETAAVDAEDPVDLGDLPWPEVETWIAELIASPLVGEGRPLHLEGTRLYLDRYAQHERGVAADLLALADAPAPPVDSAVLADGMGRLFAGLGDSRQRLAAASSVLRRLAVVAGGPGTGKTTTVARIVALLLEQAEAAGTPYPLVALAAPTGKAAARLQESVTLQAATLEAADGVRDGVGALRASTIHRLLGWRPGSHSRFRHHRGHRLPHDVVVVDEMSMVSLTLMARLVEAIRPEARLILIGDPGQLTSVEAGAVLGDIVGPAAFGMRLRPAARAALVALGGAAVMDADARTATVGGAAADAVESTVAIGDGIVVLDRVHRFEGGIAAVADAVRAGDPDAVINALRSHPDDVTWIDADLADAGVREALGVVRDGVVGAAAAITAAARAGDAHAALAGLDAFRVLCAHRRGDHGVREWTRVIEAWLQGGQESFGGADEWYVGRPLLITQNDYGLRLNNGDAGVVVADAGDRRTAAFARGGDVLRVSTSRLEAVETVYAMTIHKSQGSQFATAAVLLPDVTSRILTRELLYTAVTRAQERLIVVGTEETIRAAVARPVARASGLRERLWGG